MMKVEEKDGFSWMQTREYRRAVKDPVDRSALINTLCGCIIALAFVVIQLGWLG